MPVVGNTADTPNPPGLLPNLGVPTDQRKFSLVGGDSQIFFKRVVTQEDLVYRQYCLLPAPQVRINLNNIFSACFEWTHSIKRTLIRVSRMSPKYRFHFTLVLVLQYSIENCFMACVPGFLGTPAGITTAAQPSNAFWRSSGP